MKHPWRMVFFLAGAVGMAMMLLGVFIHLPGPEPLRSRYLRRINRHFVAERNVTDAVTAVNFDYRGFDTLGEEFILFVSVIGSVVILRQAYEKREQPLPDALTPGRDVPASEAVRLWILIMLGPQVLFGLYVITHGQLTPGGGFQGGVILASSALIIYAGEGFKTFKSVLSHPLVESAEAAGAGLFILIGMMAWLQGRPLLANGLPLGKTHELTSGGTIALISMATGLEIAAGFLLLLYAFMQETLTAGSE